MPQDRVEAVTRTRERIDYANGTVAARASDDLGNVMPDLIPERVFDGLQTSTRQNADTAFIPLLRRHTVEMNVVGVIEAVTSILLEIRSSSYGKSRSMDVTASMTPTTFISTVCRRRSGMNAVSAFWRVLVWRPSKTRSGIRSDMTLPRSSLGRAATVPLA